LNCVVLSILIRALPLPPFHFRLFINQTQIVLADISSSKG
jgi:hypothetical protein